MNLQPMNPPARDGQRLACVECGRMTGSPLADLDAPAGTFYCRDCAPKLSAPSVPDPVADTARALAGLYAACVGRWGSSKVEPYADRSRQAVICDCARACSPQVEAAFNALVTGDATRAPGVGDA